LDVGQVSDVFDGNLESFFRTKEANPLVLDLIFPSARSLSGISLRVDGTPMHIVVQVMGRNQEIIAEYSRDLSASFENRDCMIEFAGLIAADELILTVERTDDPEPANVHLWEVELK
jgi:hypothetical protein